jgi:septum site-determining protein MinD
MFDYIFLDAPAGVDALFRLTSAAADRCIVVTGSGPAAVRDAARVGELLELAGKMDVRLVVNRVDKTMLAILKQTIDDVMDAAGLPLLGIVPEDPDVPMAAAWGMNLFQYSKCSPALKCFTRIAKRIQGFPEPIKIR